MNKKTLILWTLLITSTALLAGCNNNDSEKQKNTTNQGQITNTTTKQNNTQNSKLMKLAKKVWIKNPDIKVFTKAYNVWVKCMGGYCKTQFEELKKDKKAYEYFNKIVVVNKIPSYATKYNDAKERAEATVEKGYKWLSDCIGFWKQKYNTIWDCIKENYKNWKLNKQTKKQITDYLSKIYWKYNITFSQYLELNNTCQWWRWYGFASMKEVNKQLEEMKKQGFQAVNFIKSNYSYFKNKMDAKTYLKMLNDVCEVAKFRKQQSQQKQQPQQRP